MAVKRGQGHVSREVRFQKTQRGRDYDERRDRQLTQAAEIRREREALEKKYRVTIGIMVDVDAISDDDAIHKGRHNVHNLIKFDTNHWSPPYALSDVVVYDEHGVKQLVIIDTTADEGTEVQPQGAAT